MRLTTAIQLVATRFRLEAFAVRGKLEKLRGKKALIFIRIIRFFFSSMFSVCK